MNKKPKNTDSDGDNKVVKELVESGSEITGSVSGAVVGFLLGNLAGAAVGAASGVVVSRALKNGAIAVYERFLGPRERIRIGAAATFAAQNIQDQLNQGKSPRDDGFFDSKEGRSSSSDILLEGVLLKARDAYEERKVRYIGNLYANIVFHPEISQEHAAHLVNLAGELTYTQLVALAVGTDPNWQKGLRQLPFRGDEKMVNSLSANQVALMTELYALYQRGLVNGQADAWISLVDVNFGSFGTQGTGSALAQLMQLQDIPVEDREIFVRLFPSGSEQDPTLIPRN